MEIQHCECNLCEDLRKNIQPLVFKDLESENHIPGAVCDEPSLTSSTPTVIIDETISSDITMEATIPTLIIDDPMSSDNTDDNAIPKLVIDETTSPTVTHVTLGGLSELENLFKNLIFNKK